MHRQCLTTGKWHPFNIAPNDNACSDAAALRFFARSALLCFRLGLFPYDRVSPTPISGARMRRWQAGDGSDQFILLTL